MQGRENIAHYQDKCLMTGRVKTFFRCKPFMDIRPSYCFPVSILGDKNRTTFSYFAMSCLFNALQVCFEQTYYELAQKPDNFFWTRLEDPTFALAGNQLE